MRSSLKRIVTNNAVTWVAKDIIPYDIIKDEGLKLLGQEFIKMGANHGNICINDVLPDPTTISRNVEKKCIDIKSKIVPESNKLLEKQMCAAATTDMWSDDFKKKSYLTFTIHFYDDLWQLKKKYYLQLYLPKKKKQAKILKKKL